jgi:hypothetical protein
MKEVQFALLLFMLATVLLTVVNLQKAVEKSSEDIVNAIAAQQCDHTTHPPVVEIGEEVE